MKSWASKNIFLKNVKILVHKYIITLINCIVLFKSKLYTFVAALFKKMINLVIMSVTMYYYSKSKISTMLCVTLLKDIITYKYFYFHCSFVVFLRIIILEILDHMKETKYRVSSYFHSSFFPFSYPYGGLWPCGANFLTLRGTH